MADPVAEIRTAIEKTTPIVEGIDDSQWSKSTPCAEFDVRALLNHMVGAANMFRQVIEEGQASPDASTDYLGSDPKGAFRKASGAALAAFENGDVLNRTLNMPFGEFPGPAAAGIFRMEMFVHGVDLAVSTGQKSLIDEGMCTAMQDAARDMGVDNFRVPGVFEAEVPAPAGAEPHRRMLAYLGRQV
ncbi:MAG TPA: TIGR03086 family metal-binding protein [Acidimicrobiales bacterium]|nr:TIGR03086 family metal-binding protein [Acidimicrobiales bacterium]